MLIAGGKLRSKGLETVGSSMVEKISDGPRGTPELAEGSGQRRFSHEFEPQRCARLNAR
jgi:hypothetical protein